MMTRKCSTFMPPFAAAKLYYLFSKYDDVEMIKTLMETDISGEISTDELQFSAYNGKPDESEQDV